MGKWSPIETTTLVTRIVSAHQSAPNLAVFDIDRLSKLLNNVTLLKICQIVQLLTIYAFFEKFTSLRVILTQLNSETWSIFHSYSVNSYWVAERIHKWFIDLTDHLSAIHTFKTTLSIILKAERMLSLKNQCKTKLSFLRTWFHKKIHHVFPSLEKKQFALC